MATAAGKVSRAMSTSIKNKKAVTIIGHFKPASKYSKERTDAKGDVIADMKKLYSEILP